MSNFDTRVRSIVHEVLSNLVHSEWTSPGQVSDEDFVQLSSQVVRNRAAILNQAAFQLMAGDVSKSKAGAGGERSVVPYPNVPEYPVPPGSMAKKIETFIANPRRNRNSNPVPSSPPTFAVDENGHLIMTSEDYPSGADLGPVSGEGAVSYHPVWALVNGHLILTDPDNPTGLDLGEVKGANGADGEDGAEGAQGPQGETGPAGADGTSVSMREVLPYLQTMVDSYLTQEVSDVKRVVEQELQSIVELRLTQLFFSNLWRLKGPRGKDGADGKTPIFDTVAGTDTISFRVSYDDGITWEVLASNIRGSDGQDGEDGVNGVDGTDGRDPVFFRIGDNLWWGYGSAQYNLGRITGEDGKPGEDGKDAVLPNFYISGDNLYAGSTLLGRVVGMDGAPGATNNYYRVYCPS